MKIVALGASSSSTSLNKKLAAYTAHLAENAVVDVLDINDFDVPMYSQDKENELGIPAAALDFLDKFANADALVLSFAEHNGSYAAAYKNLFDWASRKERKVFAGKPTVMLATSPGPGGAKNVLASAVGSAPHFGANLIGSLSIPSFHENFDSEKNEITNAEVKTQLVELCFYFRICDFILL
jgi:NAD(P)H-dependent FMN reductase